MGLLAKNLDNLSTEEKYPLDPRPDLEEDSRLWNELLSKAASYGSQLQGILDGFRCAGTRIVRLSSGSYALRPEISETCWESKKRYEEEKQKWLVPYSKELVKMLREIQQD